MSHRKSEIHMHSTFSDGEFPPEQLVNIAKENNVTLLSLTDHDTFDGIQSFLQAAKERHIEAFPGIEITVKFHDFNFHLLAYFKDYESIHSDLLQRVKQMTETRERRMIELIQRVRRSYP